MPAAPSNGGASVLEADGCVQGELPTGKGSRSRGSFVGTVEKSTANVFESFAVEENGLGRTLGVD